MFSSNSSTVSGGANYIEDVFSTYLYTGNGATQTITNGIDLAGKGGLVWGKSRSNADSHELSDTLRGVGNRLLSNNNTQALTGGDISAFNSTGFSLSGSGNINKDTYTYVSWTFRKQPKFFDVVTYTGTGSARTVAHSLGSIPGCIIVKRLNADANWQVYNRDMGVYAPNPQSYATVLNADGTYATGTTFWNDTNPTDTVFTVGSNASTNASGGTYIAYLFAHNAGGFGLSGTENVISCGSYEGNGSANGPIVTLGYEPQWVMVKVVDGTGNWVILDTMRGMSLTSSNRLFPNTSGAETALNPSIVPTATGFKVATTDTSLNWSGYTFIYIAIRRGPMAVPTDGTKVFKPLARTGTGGATDITGVGFSPDLVHTQSRDSYGANGMFDRLRGAPGQLRPASTVAEQTTTDIAAYLMDGVATGGSVAYINDSGIPYSLHFFKRAPGFFDEVCYTGNGSTQTITHNLGVVPELIIGKNRTTAGNNWPVLFNFASTTMNYGFLNLTNSCPNDTYANVGVFSAAPTSTSMFLVNSGSMNTNTNGQVAYLFATCPGVSKVGSYTGTGTTQAINCGFAAGARFVLIKRTDSTGDWYYWDSARGIVSGNDPYLLMNTLTAEVTNTDYIDPVASGFEISSTAPAAINASGGSFIFLAIS
jgi:hypothetical protein